MKKQLKSLALLMALLAILSALVGFKGNQTPSPEGSFTTTITAEELPQDMPSGMRKALAGTWEIIFVKDNRFQILLGDKPMVEGRFTLSSEGIVLTDEKGMISCAMAPGEETGKYKWTLDAGKITFTATDDKCEGRKLILTLHAWTKKEATVAPKK
jgi:hypothetical protein